MLMGNVRSLRPSDTPRADGALRVAMVAPPWFELPPRGYGGIETIVADLVNQLVDRGHDVLLIGAGDHRTKANRFHGSYASPPSHRLGQSVPEVLHAAAVVHALRDTEVDIVHDHSLAGPLLAPNREIPTVATMHGPVDGELSEYFAQLGDALDVVAISDAQRRLNPRLNWISTVHNAIDVATFPFEERKQDYLLWLGRFCETKGPHLAIDAARSAGRPIVLAGKCNEPSERDFFAREIEPRLGRGVDYVGEADAQQKRTLLRHARALVFPIQWEEPFGMVMIEAMACGTPVVALNRGSVPEVVVDGVTGIVVDHPARLPEAIAHAERLNPADARRHVHQHFDLPVMAKGYENTYRALLEARALEPRLA